MQGVCGGLGGCRAPGDQGVVEGLIKGVFAKLPDDFQKAEHETALRTNGLCRVRCIRGLTEDVLEDLGISVGGAMMVLDVLQGDSPSIGAAGEPRSVNKLGDRRCGHPQSVERRGIRTWRASQFTRRGWGFVRRHAEMTA